MKRNWNLVYQSKYLSKSLTWSERTTNQYLSQYAWYFEAIICHSDHVLLFLLSGLENRSRSSFVTESPWFLIHSLRDCISHLTEIISLKISVPITVVLSEENEPTYLTICMVFWGYNLPFWSRASFSSIWFGKLMPVLLCQWIYLISYSHFRELCPSSYWDNITKNICPNHCCAQRGKRTHISHKLCDILRW